MVNQTRAPKQMGDFGEGLVIYNLIMKGYEVAVVDHVGADLIAEKKGKRFAISVKTRLFKKGSEEGLAFVVEYEHIKKLEHFSDQFGMIATYAQVLCLTDENALHVIMMPVHQMKKMLVSGTYGYQFSFASRRRKEFLAQPFVNYSCWSQQMISEKDFV